jgi:hypothetical protein
VERVYLHSTWRRFWRTALPVIPGFITFEITVHVARAMFRPHLFLEDVGYFIAALGVAVGTRRLRNVWIPLMFSYLVVHDILDKSEANIVFSGLYWSNWYLVLAVAYLASGLWMGYSFYLNSQRNEDKSLPHS